MKTIPNPPTFPVPRNCAFNEEHGELIGLSLRDYFAAKAMQTFCVFEGMSYETAAEMAYRQADEMLRERVRIK